MKKPIVVSIALSMDDRKAIEDSVDEEIEKFNVWFRGLGNDSLVRSEIAAVKTFLWYKFFEEKNGTETNRSG